VIERNGILNECMEIKEEGERESSQAGAAGYGGSSRTEWWTAREAAGRDVAGGSGSGSGRWSTATAPRAGDHLAFLCASPCHSCAPPAARGTVAPCWSTLSAGHQVDPRSFTARPGTTRSPRACPASSAYPRSCRAANVNG
jgi:hypothetical protein